MLALLIGVAPCFAQDSETVPLTAPIDSRDGPTPGPVANNHDLLQKYVWSPLGLEGVLSATFRGGLDQWRKSPAEWKTGTTGYGRRWTSEYAESAIENTATYAIARVLRQDPSFTRCDCSGFVKRMNHAVLSPFTARRRDGRSVLSVASLAGVLTADVVSASTWFPARLGARDGLRNAVGSLLARIGVDVLLEFRPHRPTSTATAKPPKQPD